MEVHDWQHYLIDIYANMKIKVRLLMSNNDKHINPNNNKNKLKFTTLVLRNVFLMQTKHHIARQYHVKNEDKNDDFKDESV